VVSALLLLIALAKALSRLAPQPAPGISAYRVRVAYVIPSDREPQAQYQEKAAVLLTRIQSFYADQMERNGFGRATFSVEATADGRPDVHLIHSPMTAAVFADIGDTKYAVGKYWEHAVQSVIDGGFAPDAQGEVWLCFVEAQTQLANGSVHNDTSQGIGRFGNGFALCSGLELAMGGNPDLIREHRHYGGLVIPDIGPHPLVSHVSFATSQGDDVSSLAADYIGAAAHELGHAFLLQHCFINDTTDCGNLMGGGSRGWRGYFMPDRFPSEETRLDRPSALMLHLSPFFTKPSQLVAYSPPPKVTIQTPPGPIQLDHGMFRLEFSASEPDGPGIAMATLENGLGSDSVGVVAWEEFDGRSKEVRGHIETNVINPGREDTWRLTVMDASGNLSYQTIKLTAPRTGIGPSPLLSVAHSFVGVGENVVFKGSVKRPWHYRYLWSFGDGSTSEGETVSHVFSKPGIYQVRLTTFDPGGRLGQTSQFICVGSP